MKVKKSSKANSSDGFPSTDTQKSERQCDGLKSYGEHDQDLSHVFTCSPILSGKFIVIKKTNYTGEPQLEINEVIVYHKGDLIVTFVGPAVTELTTLRYCILSQESISLNNKSWAHKNLSLGSQKGPAILNCADFSQCFIRESKVQYQCLFKKKVGSIRTCLWNALPSFSPSFFIEDTLASEIYDSEQKQ